MSKPNINELFSQAFNENGGVTQSPDRVISSDLQKKTIPSSISNNQLMLMVGCVAVFMLCYCMYNRMPQHINNDDYKGGGFLHNNNNNNNNMHAPKQSDNYTNFWESLTVPAKRALIATALKQDEDKTNMPDSTFDPNFTKI